MKVLLTSLTFLILALPALAQGKPNPKVSKADPVGTWKVTRTWFAGTKDEARDQFTLTVRREGAKLKGCAIWPDEAPPVRPKETQFEVSYKDGSLSFRTGRGNVGDYSGKLVDGDTIKGSVGVFIVSGAWEAKRVKGDPAGQKNSESPKGAEPPKLQKGK
jgi:hypothetical protein